MINPLIKNIALYIECEAITTKSAYTNPVKGILDQVCISDNEVVITTDHGYYICAPHECKLYLRKLESITMDEFYEWTDLVVLKPTPNYGVIKHGPTLERFINLHSNFQSFPYLLSKGFDLKLFPEGTYILKD